MVLYFISHNVTKRTHSNKNNASFTAHVIGMLRQQVLQVSETVTSGPNSATLYHISRNSLPNNLVLAFLLMNAIHWIRSYMVNLFKKGIPDLLGSYGLWSLKKGSSCLHKHCFPYFHSLNFFERQLCKHNSNCFCFIFHWTYLLFVTQVLHFVFQVQGDYIILWCLWMLSHWCL